MGEWFGPRPGDTKVIEYPYWTRKGRPALWECGGRWGRTGTAKIITGPDGERKRALRVSHDPYRTNGDHALIPIKIGDRVIEVSRGCTTEVKIWKITDMPRPEYPGYVQLTLTHRLYFGRWEPEQPTGTLWQAVEAALEKAWCPDCRNPHWIR